MEMKKKINKNEYLSIHRLYNISKTMMREFFYDYFKAKFGDKIELCYADTDSFILYIKTEDFYEDIPNDVEEWFDTSNYEIDRPLLLTNKNKKVLGKFKNELRGKI